MKLSAIAIISVIGACGVRHQSKHNGPESTDSGPPYQDVEDVEDVEGDKVERSQDPNIRIKVETDGDIPGGDPSKDPFGDLIEHAKTPNGAIEAICQIPGDGDQCLSYRLVKAYFPNLADKSQKGPLKRTCEVPEGGTDYNCQLFRLERGAL